MYTTCVFGALRSWSLPWVALVMAKMLAMHKANRAMMIGNDQPIWLSLRRKIRMFDVTDRGEV